VGPSPIPQDVRDDLAARRHQHPQDSEWLGHHSLDVTLAYLADEDDTSDPVREEVNGAFPAFV